MQLTDQFNRKINYIRISVTDRCDFRCIYCMSEQMNFLISKALLNLKESPDQILKSLLKELKP